MKRLLLVSGRYLLENLHRELRLKALFEQRGIEVVFALPSRRLNANGYTREIEDDLVFQEANAVWLENERDFRSHMRQCDGVLFGSWKSYESLTAMTRSVGKPVVNFNTTSGLDHWVHGVDYACVKGPFSERQLFYFQETMPGFGNLKIDRSIVTGSIIHERFISETAADAISLNREDFCVHYRLDPELPIVAMFPKGIGSFKQKLTAWFPDWSEERREAYNCWFLDKYHQICRAVKEARCNLIIKMHPTSYTSYMCRSDEEYAYWQQVPWVRVLAPEHTYDLYQNADCGVGITTHSSLDLGYFNKPFIYVDSDKIEPPSAIPFHLNHLCEIPLGPSSSWARGGLNSVNPWFPSWLGYFCNVDDLPTLLNEHIKRPISASDRQKFISEFWHENDGQSGKRIVDFVLEYMQDWDGSRKLKTIANHWVHKCEKSLRPIPKALATISHRLSRSSHIS